MCHHRYGMGSPCSINPKLSPTIVRQESQACLSQFLANLTLNASCYLHTWERPVCCSYTIESAAAAFLKKIRRIVGLGVNQLCN